MLRSWTLYIPHSSWNRLLPRSVIVARAGMGLPLVSVMNFWTAITQELPCMPPTFVRTYQELCNRVILVWLDLVQEYLFFFDNRKSGVGTCLSPILHTHWIILFNKDPRLMRNQVSLQANQSVR